MVADTDAGAHPRSRGENCDLVRDLRGWSGSSPLTRGKRRFCTSTVTIVGLIPAHAGKTQAGTYRGMDGGAHPRSRGENHGVQSRIVNQTGSSPLTRGKRANSHDDQTDRGLIPAHAGKTSRIRCKSSKPTAHPRSRGENVPSARRSVLLTGSSPLTRGKHLFIGAALAKGGLIPAHAGKTARTCA